jgi:hypothetical protein
MTVSEQELRAALDGVLAIDDGYLPKVLSHFKTLEFMANDPAVRCASLRAYQLAGNGAVAVHFSPGGQVLKIVALFGNPDFSSTITFRLPRKYRPKKSAVSRQAAS